MAGRKSARAALGLSAHTGWAALVAASKDQVLDRRRVVMVPGGERFVYHAASELDLPAAGRLVRQIEKASLAGATAAVKEAVAALEAAGYAVVGAGLLVGAPAPPLSLQEILQAHPRLHSAEGALYRAALAAACETLGIPVAEVRAKSPRADAAARLRIPEAEVERRLVEVGRAAGRPWAKDQRDACLAAWVALSA